MTDRLEVRLDGTVVAHLEPLGQQTACRYTPSALDTFPGGTPLLSCSLPVSSRTRDATGWARGLLPEGQHLAALAAVADVTVSDTFGLLRRYGRDIAGAFEIVAGEPPPRTPTVEDYDEESLLDEILGLDQSPLAVHDDSELSVAGLQDKLLVVRTAGGWARPVNGYPSTHIMKRDDRNHPGLIQAEAACLELARWLGLTNIESEIIDVGREPMLVVERFDRLRGNDGMVERTHQEDLLQALGLAPEGRNGRQKYQRAGSAGPPSWRHLAELLDEFCVDADDARDQLIRVVTFTTLIGNADCHAKNMALVQPTPGDVRLAPLYDTVPTALWPSLRTAAALTVNDVAALPAITIDDIVSEARRWRCPIGRAEAVAMDTLELARAAADRIAHPALVQLVRVTTGRLLGSR